MSTIKIYYLETNCSDSLYASDVYDSNFLSTAIDGYPGPFFASEFLKSNFIYNNFKLLNDGPGANAYTLYDIEYGINGLLRYGIGMFYFYVPIAKTENITTVKEDQFNLKLWEYLTTFFDYLNEKDRDLFENYWHAIYLSANDLITKAVRLYNASAPEYSTEYPIENYYEIVLGPLTSKPLSLDPTNKGDNYTIRPIEKIVVEPQYNSNFEPIYTDKISILASDYYKIREVGLGCYVVVKVNRSNVADKYFKILNIRSSEEPSGRKQYAEIDESLVGDPYGENGLMYGKLAIEGFYNLDDPLYTDISQKLVQVIRLHTTSSAVWSEDSLLITVSDTSIYPIQEIIANQIGTPWANLIDKSGAYPRVLLAIFGGNELDDHAIKFHDLPAYKCAEAPNGRYVQGDGKIWLWYDGYDSSNGVEGYSQCGEYIPNVSKNKYIIDVEGDLSYIGDNTFSIYLTTVKAYDIDKSVINVPYLHTHVTKGYPIEFIKDRDYTLNDFIVEFNHDIFSQGEATIGEIVYCQKTPIIEHYLFEMFGNMIGIQDWISYNYNNYSGKTAITTVLKSLQNISTVDDYHHAMNAYYGLPLAPKSGYVVGLYESYSYKVLSIDRNNITLDKLPGSNLHPFIQDNSVFFVEGKKDVTVDAVLDRETALIRLTDTSSLSIGDLLNVKLKNKFVLKSVHMETEIDPAYIIVYSEEGSGAIQHIINLVNDTSGGKKYPEIFIYNTSHDETIYNGIYHATRATNFGDGLVKIILYKNKPTEEPLYNDYIGANVDDISGGIMHMPWPTHKFLYLHMDNGDYFKAYLDAPIDTILDSEDKVAQYQILARNASVFTKEMFPGWNQFDHFRKYSGISVESDVLEITKIFQYGTFGNYFPSHYTINEPTVPATNIEGSISGKGETFYTAKVSHTILGSVIGKSLISYEQEPIVEEFFTWGNSDPKIYKSNDLKAWNNVGNLPIGTTRVVCGNNSFAAIAPSINYPGNDGIYFSIDGGSTWIESLGLDFKNIMSIDFVNDRFFILADNTTEFEVTEAHIGVSTDGIVWDLFDTGTLNIANGKFFYFKGKYVVISTTRPGEGYNSWISEYTGSGDWNGPTLLYDLGFGYQINISDDTIAVSNDYIVIIHGDNKAYSSPNGINWTEITSLSYIDTFYQVAHINNDFWINGFYSGDFKIYSIALRDYDLYPRTGNYIENFLNDYFQTYYSNGFVYALRYLGGEGGGSDSKIYKSVIPGPFIAPNWTTDSTGIPDGTNLHQLMKMVEGQTTSTTTGEPTTSTTSTTGIPTTPQPTTTPGPIIPKYALWKGELNANDSINGFDGSWIGTPNYSGGFESGNAFNFGYGGTNGVTIPANNNPFLGFVPATTDFIIDLYLQYHVGANGLVNIISKGVIGGHWDFNFYMNKTMPGTYLTLETFSGSNRIPVSMSEGVWYHLRLEYSNYNLAVYIDDGLIGNFGFIPGSNSNAPMLLGFNGGDAQRGLILDEVYVAVGPGVATTTTTTPAPIPG